MASSRPSYRDVLYSTYRSRFKLETTRTDEHAVARRIKAHRYVLRGWFPEDRRARILDLGCGTGELLMMLREDGYENLAGVDVSSEQVALARERGLDVHEGDAVALLGSLQAEIDVITATDFLEHLTRDEALFFLQAVHGALRTRGTIILKVPNSSAPRGVAYHAADLTHEQLYSPHALMQILRACGFESPSFRESGPVPYSAAGVARTALWRALRAGFMFADMVETGGHQQVYTRVVLARSEKS